MVSKISIRANIRTEYYIPAFTIKANKPYPWELVSKGICLLSILSIVYTSSFGQKNRPMETDRIILNMRTVRDNRSCDTSRMYAGKKRGQMDAITCRLISYLEDSSIYRIEIESNDFFNYKCDRFYFLGEKLIKADVLLVSRFGMVWDRHIYHNEDEETQQGGRGQFVMANLIAADAYKIRKDAMEKR